VCVCVCVDQTCLFVGMPKAGLEREHIYIYIYIYIYIWKKRPTYSLFMPIKLWNVDPIEADVKQKHFGKAGEK
jgi:hypothetical protein